MKKFLLSIVSVAGFAFAAFGAEPIHVAPDGDDSGAGTAQSPYGSIEKALEAVEPGGTVYLHSGNYYPAKRIRVPAKNTSENARIRLFAYGDGEVIIDGSKMNPQTELEFKGSRCMYFAYDANYWHVKGIIFQNALDNGVKVEGSYNIFEKCIFRDNNDTGLQIGMFKDWKIEEVKGFPISGTPEFNPGYTYCRGNKVINCDAYNNYDAVAFGGKSDDGGDADGFACKLFPGPGTEFHGCRAWNNSDDNWDLYMVYHPVVIDNCYAWNAALDKNGAQTPGNGNGFKLGGGGSAGGSAFDQSTGAHVVRNCVAFSNTHKGFDQNNAYEAMYILNCVGWDNEYNFRFPTVFKFGTMYIRNCVGFRPTKLNHEFLSEGKDGYKMPDTDFNSWTTLDGCDPIKDGNKVGKVKVNVSDYTNQFLSLSPEDAKAPRLPDGSLPENSFVRLVNGSKFIDAGQVIEEFVPVRHMTEAEASQYGLELTVAPKVTIEYNGAAPDFGAYESGTPEVGRVYLMTDNAQQTVYKGTEIDPIVIKWGGAASDLNVEGAEGLTQTRDIESRTLTLSGVPEKSGEIVITAVGGETNNSLTLSITVSETEPGTIVCVSGNLQQTVFIGSPIDPIVFEFGGGANGFSTSNLLPGLKAEREGNRLTVSGTPETDGSFIVTATGGMVEVSLTASISREIANRILTGDWYNMQDPFDALPEDLNGVIALEGYNDKNSEWRHDRTESDGSVPSGCTQGGVDICTGGAIVWNLPSLLELKANIHFTGSRYLQIKWQVEGGVEQSWTSAKLSKQTKCGFDLMKEAGIEPTDKPITVKFVNSTSNNGGIRMYDFFAKVHLNNSQSGIERPEITTAADLNFYVTDGAIIAQSEEIAMMRLISVDGRMLASTLHSQVLPTNGAHGVVIVHVILKDGRTVAKKLILD